jgi:magnesium chelatase family protein
MIGGGTYPKPGEISLAHRGVLFLDEMPEFSRYILESLRQPVEDGEVVISRSNQSVEFPCRFILIGARNPCLCGYQNHPKVICNCTQMQILNYNKRISGPMLDRMDLFVNVNNVSVEEICFNKKEKETKESSYFIKKQVEKARIIQNKRFEKEGIFTNNEMKNKHLDKYCVLDSESETILNQAMEKFNMSVRSFYKILRIARTIADLEEEEKINKNYILEALQYRRKL